MRISARPSAQASQNKVSSSLAASAVKVAVSEPYCHFRNGKIEARHKTWKSLARAMLNGSGLDVSYWYYAIRHAVLISNIALLGTNEKGDELNVTRLSIALCHV